jgi:hypothetical protein
MISSDTHWVANIHNQAVLNGISYDEMLKKAALFTFKQNYPRLYELNRGLETVEEDIYKQRGLLDSLRSEAASYRFDSAVFIRIKAWQMYKAQEVQRTSQAILNDPVWLEQVRKKAILKGVPLKDMIRLDAEYVWEERLKEF